MNSLNKNVLLLVMLIVLKESPVTHATDPKANSIANPPTGTTLQIDHGDHNNLPNDHGVSTLNYPSMVAGSPQAGFGPEHHSEFVINAPRTTVRIDNRVDDHQDVYVHCKSKDNDLGFHVIPRSGSYQWSFKVNFWETTQFYCYLKSQFPGGGGRVVRGGFDLYVAKRDRKRCPKLCVWRVLSDGVHGYREESGLATSDLFFPWAQGNFEKDGGQNYVHMSKEIRWRRSHD